LLKGPRKKLPCKGEKFSSRAQGGRRVAKALPERKEPGIRGVHLPGEKGRKPRGAGLKSMRK